MKILITGADGFIGKNLSDSLQEEHEVYRCTRNSNLCNSNIKKYFWDISSMDCPLRWSEKSVDVVVHAAAINPSSNRSFFNYYQTNVIGTQNVINFSKTHNVKKIIFMGSVSSYGDVREDILKIETVHIEPSDYGLSKYIAQKLIENSSIVSDIIILPAVVGKDCNDSWIVNTAYELACNRRISCYNKKGLFNNIVEIEDLCNFIAKILCDHGSRSYLLGNRQCLTIQTVIESLRERLLSTSEIVYIDKGYGYTVDVTADDRYISKNLESILNIVCKEAIERIQNDR